jgi:hypothetical protein
MGLPLPSGIPFLSAVEHGGLCNQEENREGNTEKNLRVCSDDVLPADHPQTPEQQIDNGPQRETLKNSKNPKYFRVHVGSPFHLLMIPGKEEKIQHSTFRIQHFFHAFMQPCNHAFFFLILVSCFLILVSSPSLYP